MTILIYLNDKSKNVASFEKTNKSIEMVLVLNE